MSIYNAIACKSGIISSVHSSDYRESVFDDCCCLLLPIAARTVPEYNIMRAPLCEGIMGRQWWLNTLTNSMKYYNREQKLTRTNYSGPTKSDLDVYHDQMFSLSGFAYYIHTTTAN